MDNFDEIIKQKAEQFEVPYNEAHWAEMDAKLNSIRAVKIKKNLFGSAVVIAVVIAVVAISSYVIFSDNETVSKKENNNFIVDDNTTEVVVNNNTITPNKENLPVTNNTINKNIIVNANTNVSEKIEVAVEENNNSVIDNNTVKVEENNKIVSEVKTTSDNVNAEFLVYNNKVCLGEEVSFEALENNHPVVYTWNFGDGTISHKANPKHIYTESHVYTVSLTLVDKQTGKEYTTIQEDVVNILSLPNASFSYIEIATKYDNNKLKYPYTNFIIKDLNEQYSYKWTFGNGEASSSFNGKTIYEKVGNYTASLLIKDNIDGCVQLVEERVKVENGLDLFAPNAFTPDNNGDNETFIPKALLGWDVQFEMTIIDKAGKIVYQTKDKNEPWNGKMNNSGLLLSEGVYFWQVITYDAEGTPLRHHGQLNLIK